MLQVSTTRRSIALRVIQSLSANALDQAITICVQLAGIPILLHAWGTGKYGEWLILASFPAYFSFASLGLSQSASNEMTAKAARRDFSGTASLYGALRRFIWIVVGLALLLVAALSLWAPPSSWLPIRHLDARSSTFIFAALCAEAVLSQPNGVTNAGLRASGREALHVTVTALVRLLQYLALWTTAIMGFEPVWSAVAFLLIRFTGTLGLSAYLHTSQPWLVGANAPARFGHLRTLLLPALANLSFPLALTTSVQGFVMAIGAALGPVAVVTFTTTRTLTRLVFQAVAAVSNAVEPELARAHGTEDTQVSKLLFTTAFSFAFWLGVSAGLVLLVIGPTILHIWTHGVQQVQYGTLALLIAAATCSAFWYVGFAVLKSRNLHLPASIAFLACSALSVGLGYAALSQGAELWVCAAAILACDIFISVLVLSTLSRLVRVPLRSLFAQAVSPRAQVQMLRKAAARVTTR